LCRGRVDGFVAGARGAEDADLAVGGGHGGVVFDAIGRKGEGRNGASFIS
jgi:hypothetical protein